MGLDVIDTVPTARPAYIYTSSRHNNTEYRISPSQCLRTTLGNNVSRSANEVGTEAETFHTMHILS